MTVYDKKEDRRVRRTKKLLVQALTKLMSQKQIKEITVKELTDLADVNRGTFYLYYKDIFDMVEKTEDALFDALNEITRPVEDEGMPESLTPMLVSLFEFIGQNSEMVSVLLSPNGDMSFLHRLNTLLREKFISLSPFGKGGERETESDCRYSFAVFGAAGLIRSWLNRGQKESPEHMAALTNSLLFNGIFENTAKSM